MAKINLKNSINKLITSSIFITFIAFLIATFVVYRLTISKVYPPYDEEFIRDILVEAHGMLFDILIIGTFIFALHTFLEKRHEKNRNIQRWKEEIDDYRRWDEKEATHRIVGMIKRLNKNNSIGIDLRNCFLKGAKLGDANLQGADLRFANLEGADLGSANLEGAYLGVANLQGVRLVSANLQGAKLWDSNLQGAILRFATLKRASLDRTSLEGADLKDVRNLTIEQLSEVKTLHLVKNLNPDLMEQIKEKYPELLEKPKDEEKEEEN